MRRAMIAAHVLVLPAFENLLYKYRRILNQLLVHQCLFIVLGVDQYVVNTYIPVKYVASTNKRTMC